MLLENIPKSAEMIRDMHKGSLVLSFLYIRSQERCWAIEAIASYMRTFQEMGNADPAMVTKVFNKRFKTHPATISMVDRGNLCLKKTFGKLAAHASHFGRRPIKDVKIEAGETGIMVYYWLCTGLYIQHIPIVRLGEFSIRCEMMLHDVENVILFNNYHVSKKK